MYLNIALALLFQQGNGLPTQDVKLVNFETVEIDKIVPNQYIVVMNDCSNGNFI
jgi:hypothetical protein